MDLSIDIEEYKLNIRAAVIITHKNKILLHRDLRTDYYALVGGRVKLGETSEETIKREIKEEMGKDIEIKGYIATIENFFNAENKKYHEIIFVYDAEFIDKKDKENIDTIKNIEGEEYLRYEWIDIKKIDQYDVRPKTIKEILKKEEYPVHQINIS